MGTFGSMISTSDIDSNTLVSPTPAATINLNAATGNLFKWTAGENETVNITAGQLAGRLITLMIENDGILPRTITLGTGIKPIGVIVGTTLRTANVVLQSDGTTFWELSRTLGL